MPLISVIIPIYNVDRYLKECLDSVINQTFEDIEIICINDGSTDNSCAVLEEYAKKNSKIVVVNQENKGQSVARNVGLQVARGKYISFVDSDDFINTDMYESLIPFMSGDVNLVVFDVNVFGEQDNSMNKYFRMKFCGEVNIDGNAIFRCPVTPWNKIYRKDIIEKYEILFPEKLHYEDNSFHWKYMMHAKKAYFLKKKLYNYRIRKNSIIGETKSKNSKVTDHFILCLEIFEYMKKYGLEQEYQTSFVKFFEHCIGVVCANTKNLRKSMKIANEIWSKINISSDNNIICALQHKDYDYVIKWIGYSFLEKMCSVKKRYGRKVITICGHQFGINDF